MSMSIAEEAANEAACNGEIVHEAVWFKDDDGIDKNHPVAEKDEEHCVKVLEPLCQTWVCEVSENNNEFNFVEEFDKIVANCTEDAEVKTERVQVEGIHDDVEIDENDNAFDARVQVEGIHDDVEIEEKENAFDAELKFLEEWLVKPKNGEDADCVMNFEYTIVAEVENIDVDC